MSRKTIVAAAGLVAIAWAAPVNAQVINTCQGRVLIDAIY